MKYITMKKYRKMNQNWTCKGVHSYGNRSVGNHFVMSYGNGTVEDGIVISIPIKNDANVYDYR